MQGALADDVLETLLAACPKTWHDLPPEEGRVRQCGQSAMTLVENAGGVIQGLAAMVAEMIGQEAGVPVPRANEANWTRYPEGEGFITRHRDPSQVTGVITIATLIGSAPFRVWEGDEVVEWDTQPGDLILLRCTGWPTADAVCVDHEAGLNEHGERRILTLRHNSAGAGAEYVYGAA